MFLKSLLLAAACGAASFNGKAPAPSPVADATPIRATTTRIDVNLYGPSCSGGIPGRPKTYYRVLRGSSTVRDWTPHPGNGGNTNVTVAAQSGWYTAEGATRDSRGRYEVKGRTAFNVNSENGNGRPTVPVSVCWGNLNKVQ